MRKTEVPPHGVFWWGFFEGVPSRYIPYPGGVIAMRNLLEFPSDRGEACCSYFGVSGASRLRASDLGLVLPFLLFPLRFFSSLFLCRPCYWITGLLYYCPAQVPLYPADPIPHTRPEIAVSCVTLGAGREGSSVGARGADAHRASA